MVGGGRKSIQNPILSFWVIYITPRRKEKKSCGCITYKPPLFLSRKKKKKKVKYNLDIKLPLLLPAKIIIKKKRERRNLGLPKRHTIHSFLFLLVLIPFFSLLITPFIWLSKENRETQRNLCCLDVIDLICQTTKKKKKIATLFFLIKNLQ